MKMHLNENVNNGVNGTGVLNEGASPGRDNVRQQALPDRHHAIARKKWSKQVNIVIMGCYYRSKPLNDNGVPTGNGRTEACSKLRNREYATKLKRLGKMDG